MKLSEVTTQDVGLEFRAQHPKWYRKLALDLDIEVMPGSTEGFNLPKLKDGGCWFGGTLVYRGGIGAEHKRREGIVLPFTTRAEHWLKAVARVLDEKVAEGHSVFINEQPTFNDNTIRRVQPAATNTFTAAKLLAHVNDPMTYPSNPYPRLCWWITNDPV